MTIEILLADDQNLILETMKAILGDEPEIKIVGTATNGKSAIEQAVKLQPDLVLIDIEMPKMNGIVATKHICEYMPYTKVIVLTSHKEESYIEQALQAGASGYLLKDTLIQDLKQAIRSLYGGYSYIEAELNSQSLDRLKANRVAKYQDKVAYLKKHRKSIYRPASKRQKQTKIKVSRTLNRHSAQTGITKNSLAPIFEPPSTQEIGLNRLTPSKRQVYTLPVFNRRSYLRRTIWMLIAIASFVLSVIIV